MSLRRCPLAAGRGDSADPARGGDGRSPDRSVAAVAAGTVRRPHRLAPAAVERRRKNSRLAWILALSVSHARRNARRAGALPRLRAPVPCRRRAHPARRGRRAIVALVCALGPDHGVFRRCATPGRQRQVLLVLRTPLHDYLRGRQREFQQSQSFRPIPGSGDWSADLVAPGRHAPPARARPSRAHHAPRDASFSRGTRAAPRRKRLGLSPQSGVGRRSVRRPVVALAGRNLGNLPGRGSLDRDLLPHGVVGPQIHRPVGGRGLVDRRFVGDFRLRPRQQPAGRPFLRLAGKA